MPEQAARNSTPFKVIVDLKPMKLSLRLTTFTLGLLLLGLTGCQSSTTTDSAAETDTTPTPTVTAESGESPAATSPAASAKELNVEQVLLAKGSGDNLQPVEEPVFQRGETVNMVLLNVGKFEKDPAGKNSFNIDMQVEDPDGKVIFDQSKLLGEQGQGIELTNDTADSPYGYFQSTAQMQPGEYTLTLTIYDEVGGGSVTKTETVTLQ